MLPCPLPPVLAFARAFFHANGGTMQTYSRQAASLTDNGIGWQPEVNPALHAKRSAIMNAPSTLLWVTQADIDGVIGRLLCLPAVVAVVARNELYILEIMLINDEIFYANPAVKFFTVFKLTAQPTVRTNDLSFHKLTSLSCEYQSYLKSNFVFLCSN